MIYLNIKETTRLKPTEYTKIIDGVINKPGSPRRWNRIPNGNRYKMALGAEVVSFLGPETNRST